jgi:hypothetical protein
MSVKSKATGLPPAEEIVKVSVNIATETKPQGLNASICMGPLTLIIAWKAGVDLLQATSWSVAASLHW